MRIGTAEIYRQVEKVDGVLESIAVGQNWDDDVRVVLFVVLWWFSSRPRPAGTVSGLFLTCYGSFRFLVEFVRQPDQQLGFVAFDWLTMGQLLSLPMIVGGLMLFGWALRRRDVAAGT